MRRLIALVFVCAAAATAAAQAPAPAADPTADVRAALADRDPARARQLADAALAAHPERKLDLLFLRALARHAAGDAAGALADFEAVAADPGAGGRAIRAGFARADVLAGQARHADARTVAEQAVEALRKPERRRALARVYLDEADRLLRTAEGDAPGSAAPDHAGALPLLRNAEALEPGGAEAAEVSLRLARVGEAMDHPAAERITRGRAWLTANPGHAAAEEVRFRLGKSLVRAGQPAAAREEFLRLADAPAPRAWAARALEAIVDSATPALWPLAEKAAERLLAEHGGDPRAPAAAVRLAEAMGRDGAARDRAIALLERVGTGWPAHEAAGRSRLRQAEWLAARGEPDAALALLRRFVTGRPVDAAWQAAVARMAEIRHDLGQRHLAAGRARGEGPGADAEARKVHFAAARDAWRGLLEEAPADRRVPGVLLALAEMDRLEKRRPEAIAGFTACAERFPGTREATEARLAVGDLHAEGGDVEKALAAYALVPEGASRAATLRAPLLEFEAPRVFAPGEPPVLQLKSRGADVVSIGLHRVDLGAHFRETGDLATLAALDVSFVRPDRTFDVRPEARPMVTVTRAIPLAEHVGAGPGAWLVTARTGLLEARTALVVSDLETLAAASKLRTWTSAADRRRGAPVEGAATQVAGDGRLWPLGPTLPPEAPAGLTLLATREGDAALARVDRTGLRDAPTPGPTAAVVLDRAVVRAGDRVHAFGWVRGGGEFRVEWHEVRGDRRVGTTALTPSPTGAFMVTLDTEAALVGSHRLECRVVHEAGAADAVLARARLDVVPPPTPALTFDFELPALPVAPGGRVRVPVVLRDADGEPAALEAVKVAIGSGTPEPRTTDAVGRLVLDVGPPHTTAAGGVGLRIEARGTAGRTTVPVRMPAPSAAPEGAIRDGVPAVAGEAYPVRMRLRDAAGRPAGGASVRVSLWRQDPVLGARPVGEAREAKADAEGLATANVTPTAGGPHEVRLEAGDAAWPQRESWMLAVAGPGDSSLVRLVPERVDPAAGSEAVLRIHSALTEGPAWLVVHDTELREARRVALPRGLSRHTVRIPVGAGRNVRVSCVVAREGQSVVETVVFDAARPLTVGCIPDRPLHAPGATARLALRVAGGDGRPLPAECVVCVVAESEADALAGRLADPAQVLTPPLPGPLVSLATSAAFVPPAVAVARDAAVEGALAEARGATGGPGLLVGRVPGADRVGRRPMPGEPAQEMEDAIGVGGGAGGQYGGRFGGKRDLVARGGGGRGSERAQRLPLAPILVRGPVTCAADGTATVEVPLPLARGRYVALVWAAAGTMGFGTGEAVLEVGGDLDVEVEAPAWLRAGDRAAARVRLVNRTDRERRLAVASTVRGALGAASRSQEVVLPANGGLEVAVELAPTAAGEGAVAIEAGGIRAERPVRVRPADPTVRLAVSGPGTLPGGPGAGPVRVEVHGSAAAALMAIADDDATDDPRDAHAAAMRCWAAAEALAAARAHGAPADVLARWQAKADARTWRVLAQAEPGALGLVALARAEAAGCPVPEGAREAARRALDAAFAAAADDGTKAFLLFARALDESPPWAWIHRLHRDRARLDVRALACLAHTTASMGRAGEARALLAELETRAQRSPSGVHFTLAKSAGGEAGDDHTLTALVVAATGMITHESETLAAARAWLEARRDGPTTVHGLPAVLVLRLAARTAPVVPPARVVVTVRGAPGGELALASAWASARLDVPAADEAVAIGLEAAVPWRAWRDVALASPAAGAEGPLVRRVATRIFGRFAGERVAAGHDVLTDPAPPAAVAATARLTPGWPTAVRCTVLWRQAPPGNWWIVEPLPSGAVVDVAGVEGAAEVLRDGDALRLRLRRVAGQDEGTVTYTWRPRWPGVQAVGPARFADRRGATAVSASAEGVASVEVAAAGADPRGDEAPTPDERVRAGALALEANDHRAVREWLLPLAERSLVPARATEVARLLCLASVGAAASEDAVRFFEVLKERDPGFVVTFETTAGVGRAYAQMGEAERGRQVQEALAEALFLQEAAVVGALEAAGRTRQAFDAMERLLAEHGDGPEVRTTLFAYAQRAIAAARGAPGVPAPGDEGLSREEAYGRAIGALERLLGQHAPDAAAEEMAVTLAATCLESGRHARAGVAARSAGARFVGGEFGDSFDYVQAAAAFATKDFDAALALCQRMATHDYGERANPDPAGLVARAKHLTAQVRHAKGELAAAVEAYREVAPRIPDAARALAFLEGQGVKLPPLTTVRGNEPVVLPVEHRGGGRLEIQAWPVDLRRLALTRRTEGDLGGVRLAGVPPTVSTAVELPAARASAPFACPLEVPAGPGAWLVVVRMGGMSARGLVLRSDLRCETQEEGACGDVRVNLLDAAGGTPATGVAVTFVDQGGHAPVTRPSDLRGVAEGSGFAGTVTVVAERDGHFALHLGTVAHGAASGQLRFGAAHQQDEQDHNESENAPAAAANDLDERLKQVQDKNRENWGANTSKAQKGVEAGRAKR